MNNLKERNPVPTSAQTSSEDPPGFIYPSYQAAGTETQRDMPSLESSHQGIAYLVTISKLSRSAIIAGDPYRKKR